MNFLPKCRKGDVAAFKYDVTVKHSGREFVVRRGTFVYIVDLDVKETAKRRRWHWRVESFKRKSVDGAAVATVLGVNDCALRPIRPGDGEDEMLRIAGKPRDTSLEPKRQAEHSR